MQSNSNFNPFDRVLRAGFERQLQVAGSVRDIVIISQSDRITRRLRVLWSEDAFKDMPISGANGGIYYQGDVMLSVRKSDLNARPKPEQIIESPPGSAYKISDVSDDTGVYYLTLVRHE